jgi:SpoVK/Ycf46/Vps4 family AAA+-type ATPase
LTAQLVPSTPFRSRRFFIPFTLIYGNLGSGKTLLLTILAFISKKPVVSNFKLDIGKSIREFDIRTFMKAEYQDSVVLMDEIYIYLESRLSMSKKNRYASYILFQSRKKNLELYGTVQLARTVDLRYRNLADCFIHAEGLTKFGYKYTQYDLKKNSVRTIYLPIENAKQFYKMFNTNEIVMDRKEFESDFFKTEEEKAEYVKKYASEIVGSFSGRTITKGMVSTYMFDHKLLKCYATIIYDRIKTYEMDK